MLRFARRKTAAFTLIELLIVVAIIAILAAIAVPNFLEAQVRAKVSRVRSDMRTYATALESYIVDYNSYPNDQDNRLDHPTENGFLKLTTPVAYLTTLPRDPFAQAIDTSNAANDKASPVYSMGSGADHAGWGNQPAQGVGGRVQSWLLISTGTDVFPVDQSDDSQRTDRWPWGAGPAPANPVVLLAYDPTNGTVSDGDIYRAGGNLNVGNWRINGQFMGDINR
jgi:type II secretion system protein G